MKALLLALVMLVPRPVVAQDIDARTVLIAAGVAAGVYAAHRGDEAAHDRLTWPDRRAADWLSTGAVAAAVLEPCIRKHNAVTDMSTRSCLGREGLRVGLAIGVAEATKFAIHRTRPDASDRKSFFSEHTAIACTAGLSSKRELLGLALCGAAGYLRVAGERHWLTDVVVGAGVGFGMSRIAR